MKKLLLMGLILVIAGCGLFQTVKDRVNTVLIGYESVATIAFPTVEAYLERREANGTLSGDNLVKSKATYAQARTQFLGVGDTMSAYIDGKLPASALANIPVILRQVSIFLADLSGGKVEGNKVSIPKPYVKYTASTAKVSLSPAEIEALIASLNMVIQIVISQIGDSSLLTVDEKAAFKTRITTAQAMVLEWR